MAWMRTLGGPRFRARRRSASIFAAPLVLPQVQARGLRTSCERFQTHVCDMQYTQLCIVHGAGAAGPSLRRLCSRRCRHTACAPLANGGACIRTMWLCRWCLRPVLLAAAGLQAPLPRLVTQLCRKSCLHLYGAVLYTLGANTCTGCHHTEGSRSGRLQSKPVLCCVTVVAAANSTCCQAQRET